MVTLGMHSWCSIDGCVNAGRVHLWTGERRSVLHRVYAEDVGGIDLGLGGRRRFNDWVHAVHLSEDELWLGEIQQMNQFGLGVSGIGPNRTTPGTDYSQPDQGIPDLQSLGQSSRTA
jgi:hypothetical protein